MAACLMPRATRAAAEARLELQSASPVVLSTKLHVPATAPNFVPRPRLAEQLTNGLTRGVVLVTAPAGFGKTSMLADWAQGLAEPVAWLSVDDADNRADRFWQHLASGFERALVGAPHAMDWDTGARRASGATATVASVINAADAADTDVVLVIDDYDRIHDPSIHEGMALLLERRPERLSLVLAGRAEPALPVARLRSTGHLFELGGTDLRLRDSEVAAVVREAGLDLPEETLLLLATRTEGWAAGIQFACLSLEGRECPSEHAAGFGGRNRYVLDFFVQDVLGDQPPENSQVPAPDVDPGQRLGGPRRRAHRSGRQPGTPRAARA